MSAATRHVSPYSGSWYPAEVSELKELLAALFAGSEKRTGRYMPPRAAGFVVPHAGLVYSGTVAAAAYRHLRALAPERVVLLGFPHHGAAPGAWIPEVEAYDTPLGEVEIDRELAAELLQSGAFGSLEESALCDHSVEIQLPLLQAAVPAARVVPVYVSSLDAASRAAAAQALAAAADSGACLVASSDFTHFGRAFGYQPFPVDDSVAERLQELDGEAIEAAGTLDPEEFRRVLSATGSTVCGREPIALLLESMRILSNCEEIFQDVLDYQTSGEITGDFHHSVSYAALGYFPYGAFELGPEDRRLLIESARNTLGHYLETGQRKAVRPEHDSRALDRRAGVFVTLHSPEGLRGCVGRRQSSEGLGAVVPSLTFAAALEDSRFPPVRRGEFGLEVEISVLSPMKRLLELNALRAGEHGALLETRDRHGLLLPQVASERNWDARRFLDALAQKAGVSRDVYRDPDSRVYVFRAQIIR